MASPMCDTAAWTPACMTAAERLLWEDTNLRLPESSRRPRPCYDCPAAFRLAMQAAGCCNDDRPGPGGRGPRPGTAARQAARRERKNRAQRERYARRVAA